MLGTSRQNWYLLTLASQYFQPKCVEKPDTLVPVCVSTQSPRLIACFAATRSSSTVVLGA